MLLQQPQEQNRDLIPFRLSKAGWAKISALAMVIVVVVVFLLFYFYRAQIKFHAKMAVETFGYPALFFLCWAADVIIQPIPADVVVLAQHSVVPTSETSLVAGFQVLLAELPVTLSENSLVHGDSEGFLVQNFCGPAATCFVIMEHSQYSLLASRLFLTQQCAGLAVFTVCLSPR